jgi:acetolactate synthase-1/2/3 large subunit
VDLNRRAALGAFGALGAATLAQSMPRPALAQAGPVLGPGVRGRMSGALAAATALACRGTPCVFGVPGAQNNELWDAFKTRGVPYLLVTNESSASVMADASARVTGRPGVFCVVPGPGLTNALSGIGEALADGVPVVGLVTEVRRGPGAPIGQVHDLPIVPVLRPICKAVLEVQHQGQIPGAIFRAFQLATAGEPGPVVVVIPFPLYTEAWDFDEPVPFPLPAPFDEAAYRKAVRLLADRRLRVGIFAGMGCIDAGPALAGVAELLQAPVATTVSGKGVIPDAHPLAVGWGYGAQGTRAAERRFKDVDVVLAVGARYSEVSTANYSIPEHDHVIQVDINPNNIGKNVHACVGVQADANVFLTRLLGDAPAVRRPPCPALWQQIAADRDRDRRANAEVRVACPVDPMAFLLELRRQLCPDDLVFIDVTAATHWAAEAIAVPGPRRYFTPANNQAMGWSVPAAVGAQRVRPDRRVAAVVGDGCFLMSGLEASTAAREGLPVKFFILDDAAYHYMQMLQEPTFRRTTATQLARIDYPALARGLGLGYVEVAATAGLAAGVARALAMPGPVLTRLPTCYENREIRWLKALKASYINHLTTGQKARMAARIAARSLNPRPDND